MAWYTRASRCFTSCDRCRDSAGASKRACSEACTRHTMEDTGTASGVRGCRRLPPQTLRGVARRPVAASTPTASSGPMAATLEALVPR